MKDLDPKTLTAFDASLREFSPLEVQKRKAEFMNAAIETYGRGVKKYQKTLIIMGIVSVLFLPFFIISIPTYLNYLSTSSITKKNLRWALDQWEQDLGSDYPLLFEKLRSY